MNARILTSSVLAVALTVALSSSSALAGGCHTGGYGGGYRGGSSYHGGGYRQNDCLPKLGFVSQTVYHAGERVLAVTPGGIACLMGLEPGDFILSINGLPLHYECSWRDGLREAIACGGHIDLEVRKCNGQIVYLHWDLYGAPPVAHAPGL